MAEERQKGFIASWGASIYLAVVGLGLLAIGWGAVSNDAASAATTVFLLGGGALIAAPLLPRIDGTLRLGGLLELPLRQQVRRAVQTADPNSLEAILPLLTSDEVAVATMRMPDRLANSRLVDQRFAFLRRRMKVEVLAVRLPTEQRWRAGGAISELPLPEGTEMIVAGHRDTLSYLKFLAASADDRLWNRLEGDVTDA